MSVPRDLDACSSPFYFPASLSYFYRALYMFFSVGVGGKGVRSLHYTAPSIPFEAEKCFLFGIVGMFVVPLMS